MLDRLAVIGCLDNVGCDLVFEKINPDEDMRRNVNLGVSSMLTACDLSCDITTAMQAVSKRILQ